MSNQNIKSRSGNQSLPSIFFVIHILGLGSNKVPLQVQNQQPSNSYIHDSKEEVRNSGASPGRSLMNKYNPFIKRARKKTLNKNENPSINFAELPRNNPEFDDESLEESKDEEMKTTAGQWSPLIDKSRRLSSRKSPKTYSHDSLFISSSSPQKFSQRESYEGVNTIELIKRFEKEIQDCEALRLSGEAEV